MFIFSFILRKKQNHVLELNFYLQYNNNNNNNPT
jgi:hypothetical protein